MPFVLNRAQEKYYNEVWLEQDAGRDANAKVRKYGLSTLRTGLGVHLAITTPGHDGRAFAPSETPAKELAEIPIQIYTSAQDFFTDCGEDWRYFLPRNTSTSMYGLKFGGINSRYVVGWAGQKGVGRLIVAHDLYFTELQEWDDIGRVDTLLSSIPPGSSARVTGDFNANENWRSTPAWEFWQSAGLPHDDPDWNGFTQYFIGVDDMPDYYTPAFLEQKRRDLRTDKRFRLDYPRRVEDLYVQSERCVFDADAIAAAFDRTGGKYLEDILTPAEIAGKRALYGVDSSGGDPDGDADYQATVRLAWHDGMWWEIGPALHMRVDEDVYAAEVDRVARRPAGVCTVERKWGLGVNATLYDLGTPGLYRHMERDRSGKQVAKLGFPMTGPTKRLCVMELKECLRSGTIGLATPQLKAELIDFEWYRRDDPKTPRGEPCGAPKRKGAHDDLVDALMIALQGQAFESTGVGMV